MGVGERPEMIDIPGVTASQAGTHALRGGRQGESATQG